MTADLHALWALLARRWAVIVPAVVLVPALTMLLTVGQPKVYSARAQVLLTYTDVGASVNGVAPAYPSTAPDRNVATQAALARNPAVARQALNLAHVNMSATDLLHDSSVTTSTSADLLTFAVDGSSPQRAMTLASDYAQAYTMYRGQIARQTISSSLSGINRRLQELSAAGQTGTPTDRFLSHDQQELSAIQAAGTNDAVVVQRAQSASAAGPHPGRTAALGLGLGIALAAALAFLMETLDKRASVEEIARRLRLPNLAMIPETSRWRWARVWLSAAAKAAAASGSRRLIGAAGAEEHPERAVAQFGAEALAVVRDPYARTAEAYRVLSSSLEFARLEHDFKSLLFTSARQPCRSETVANLAVTLVQSGRRVLLCDLNAGPSSISELFRLEDLPGMTEVASGNANLEECIVSIPASSLLPSSRTSPVDPPHEARVNGRARASAPAGYLGVLPFGGSPAHSGFLGTRAVAELVEELGHAQADLVLIDAPPLLVSGEAQTLSALADALIVILVDPVRPTALTDVAETLSRLPALPLGFITVGVAREAAEGRDHGGRDVGTPTFGEIKRIGQVRGTGNGHVAAPAPLDVPATAASVPEPFGAGLRVDASAPLDVPATAASVPEPSGAGLRVDVPAPLAASVPEPVGVGPSRLSTAPRSVPADLWRIFGGLCAIAGETALERFPRAGRITGEMSQKAAYELRRSLQPRIEAWSTLAALLR